jgi:flavin-dependent dehydrogenase
MDKQFEIRNSKFQIVIVGAGPAGASLAIRLAEKGFEIVLIEREKFPRPKLCGEFISPECLRHFRELGVFDSMLSAGGARIAETVFYAPNGKNISVPSKWLGNSDGALSLSRAEMDFRLAESAKNAGVEFLEETQVSGLLVENEMVRGVKIKNKTGKISEISADLVIDATGRANVLGKLAEKCKIKNAKLKTKDSRSEIQKIQNPKSKIQNRLVGFKTHLENAKIEKSRCEIYFFGGGYGGLSPVENNLANHCFLIKAEIVKEFSGDADKIVREIIFKNERARETLKHAVPVRDWLAVSVESFGVKNLNPARNLFSVGDAAAFIDPFTGSGMLMALESAEILAQCIADFCFAPEQLAEKYRFLYRRKFQNRLRVCSVLRRAAFLPNLSGFLISALGFSDKAGEFLARATRDSLAADKNS